MLTLKHYFILARPLITLLIFFSLHLLKTPVTVNSVTLVSSILFLSFSSPFLFFQSLFSFSTPCSLLFRYIQSFQELLRLLHVLHHKLYLTRVFVLVVRLPFYSISQKTDNLSKTDWETYKVMQNYITLLTETKEASGVSKLFQSSPNSNLAKLRTMGQRRKRIEKYGLKKHIISRWHDTMYREP